MQVDGIRGRYARLAAGLSVCIAAGALSSIAVATSDGTASAMYYTTGKKGHKVVICHKPDGENPHTITVSENAVDAHLAHGDSLGPCPS